MTCPPLECPEEECGEDECCVDGYCIPCPDYGCTGEEECEEGECCIDGECVACDPCSPGDCGEGFCCVNGQCYPCPPPPDDPCSPGDCPEGECCVDGYCLPCPPEECPGDPCPPGRCCIDGYCINPCPPGEVCCQGECRPETCDGCCCVDGAPDPSKNSPSLCEAAGGEWFPGEPCGVYDPRCCTTFRVACRERVWSTYSKVFPGGDTGSGGQCDDCEISDDAAGTVRVIGPGGFFTTASQCNGEEPPLSEFSDGSWLDICPIVSFPDPQTDVSYEKSKYYERWRIVDDCDECMDDGGTFCTPGVELLDCVDLNEDGSLLASLASCDLVDPCANPLP
jgi:hypothetical protein